MNTVRVRARACGAGPPEKCPVHVHHPFHPFLQENVERSGAELRPREPRRLLAAFRRGIKIGGAECGLAVRDQRSWQRRRGSTSAVSTIGGGGATTTTKDNIVLRYVNQSGFGFHRVGAAGWGRK